MATVGTRAHGSDRAPLESGTRERLVAAAVRVYARFGAAGTTSRRIAAEAQVNEVTLFRHFGSKEALVDAAVQAVVHASAPGLSTLLLPSAPHDPVAELTDWCAQQLDRLREAAAVLQHCFAEQRAAGPTGHAWEALLQMHDALARYVASLEAAGFMAARDAPRAVPAIAMLVSVLATDALGRYALPALLPASESSPQTYAETFLMMLGVSSEAVSDDWEGEGWWSTATRAVEGSEAGW